MKAVKFGTGNYRNTRLYVLLLILAVTLAAGAVALWPSDNEATADDPTEFDYGGVRYVITSEDTVRARTTYANQSSYNLSDVINPEGNKQYRVTEISQRAFQNVKAMKSINLGNDLVKIGIQAFQGCTGLTEITIPSGVKTLDTQVFDGCTKLKKIQSKVEGEVIECDDGVFDLSYFVTIKSYSLRNVSECVTVKLGKDLDEFDSQAIRGCPKFMGFEIPKGGKYFVESGALITDVEDEKGVKWKTLIRAPTGHTEYSIPEGVQEAGLQSLADLTTVTLHFPKSYVRGTHYNILVGSSNLVDIVFHKDNEVFKSSVERGSSHEDGPSTGGMWLSKNGESLWLCPAGKTGEIIVPKGVYNVGLRAFGDLKNVTKIDLGEVKSLNSMAFAYVEGLEVLFIPKTLTKMTGLAFSSLKDLKAIYVHPDNPVFTGWDLSGQNLGEYTPPVSVSAPPFGDYSKYDGAVYSYVLESGKRVLKTVVVVPDSIHQPNEDTIDKVGKTVGNHAFVLPGTVETIGENAFSNCGKLTNINLPSELKSIERTAFQGCISLATTTGGIFELPNTIESIGERSFTRCDNIMKFAINSGGTGNVEDIDGVLFKKVGETLTLVLFPSARGGSYTVTSNVTHIQENAFSYSALEELKIEPGAIKTLGKIILEPKKLRIIEIPSTVEEIDKDLVRGSNSNNSFSRFYLNSQSEVPLDISTMAKTDISLRGTGNGIFYAEMYLVTFMADGKFYTSETLDHGLTATKPKDDPKKNGFVFIEWQNADGTVYDFKTKIEENTTIYAYFGHSVEFKNGTETYGEIVKLRLDETTSAPEGKPSHPSDPTYEFKWWAEQGTTAKFVFGNTITRNLVLVAFYEKEIPLPIANDLIYNGEDNREGTSYAANDYYYCVDEAGLYGGDAGYYEATFKLKDSSYVWAETDSPEYTFSGSECTLKWTIKARPVTITVASETFDFNTAFDLSSWNANYEEKLAGDLAGSDNISDLVESNATFYYMPLTEGGEVKTYEKGAWKGGDTAVDEYKIGVEGLSSKNYTITIEPGILTCKAVELPRPVFNDPVDYDGTEKYAISSENMHEGYKVDVTKKTDAGKHPVTVSLEYGYVWEDSKIRSTHSGYFEINPKEVNIISWPTLTNPVYDGTAKDIAPTWDESAIVSGDAGVNGSGQKKVDVKAEVTEGSNVDAGSFTLTASLIGDRSGNYKLVGDLTKTYDIEPDEMPAITLDPAGGNYDGDDWMPRVTLSFDGGKTLAIGTDYELTWTKDGIEKTEAVDAGTYTLTATGMGNYTGTSTKDFEITKKILTIIVSSFSSGDNWKYYDGAVMVYELPGSKAILRGLVTGDKITGGTITTNEADAKQYKILGTDWKIVGLETEKGISNYIINYDVTLEIRKATLPEITKIDDNDMVYDGDDWIPRIPLGFDSSMTLKEGTDYTLRWEDDKGNEKGEVTDAGAYKVIATAMGNYADPEDKRSAKFAVKHAPLPELSAIESKTYDGKDWKTRVIAFKGEMTLDEGEDYNAVLMRGPSHMVVGEAVDVDYYDISVTGIGNYEGQWKERFEITEKSLIITVNDANAGSSKTYDGTPLAYMLPGDANLDGLVEDDKITGGTITTVSKDVGKYTAEGTTGWTIEGLAAAKGISNYAIAYDVTLAITQADLPEIADIADKTYNGRDRLHELTLVDSYGNVLAEGTDYTVSGVDLETEDPVEQAVDVGRYGIAVTGIGNYEGSWKQDFRILPASLPAIPEFSPAVYNGEDQLPALVISGLSEGRDYDKVWKDSDGNTVTEAVNVGVYTVTATGKGNYKGTQTQTFEIGAQPNPASYKVVVNLDAAGGSVKPAILSVDFGKTAKSVGLPMPVYEGKDFHGWYIGDTPVGPDYMFVRNVTLTAHWTDMVDPEPTPTPDPEEDVDKGSDNTMLIVAAAVAAIAVLLGLSFVIYRYR